MTERGTTERGTVVGLFIAPVAGGPVEGHDEVRAVASRGLEGDHYFDSNLGGHDPADEITLIGAEGLREARTEHGVDFAPGEHRRNVVVEGLDLPALVGRTVSIGQAEIEVLADNPPCKHLRDLTGKPVLKALRRRGGVRAHVATGGAIQVGDAVQPC